MNSESKQVARTLVVLNQVRKGFPQRRLYAGHRIAIRSALTDAGIDVGSEVGQCVETTLNTAERYEADGMFAVGPTWDLLLNRVTRLHESVEPQDGPEL